MTPPDQRIISFSMFHVRMKLLRRVLKRHKAERFIKALCILTFGIDRNRPGSDDLTGLPRKEVSRTQSQERSLGG